MKTVNDFWESYEYNVIPETASAIQKQETQKAFYAGCFAFLALIRSDSSVEAIEAEITMFVDSIGPNNVTTH